MKKNVISFFSLCAIANFTYCTKKNPWYSRADKLAVLQSKQIPKAVLGEIARAKGSYCLALLQLAKAYESDPNVARVEKERVYELLTGASNNGDKNIVEFLLSIGAEVNAHYHDDNTPLMWAAGAGQTEIVTLLISKGADVNARGTRCGFEKNDTITALSLAEEKGYTHIISLLKEAGAQ